MANKQARIEELVKLKQAVDEKRKEKEDEKAKKLEKSAKEKAAKEQAKKAKEELHLPVLTWLKTKQYCPQEETIIKKQYMVVALESNRLAIMQTLRGQGAKMTKSTALATMVQLFRDHVIEHV